MSMLEQVVRLDMKPQKNPPHVDCTQYDSGADGWLIRAYLYDNGSSFVIPSGYTAKIEGTTKENTGFTFAASSILNASGVVTFSLTEDATAFKGSAWCKIVFEKGSSRISTSGFWLDNDKAGVEAETVIGASGFEEQIINAVNAWLDEHGGGGGAIPDAPISYNIMNAIVAEYMANVTYNPNDYSTTEIVSYYKTATAYRKDQPNSVTIPIRSTGTLRVYDGRGVFLKSVTAGNETVCNLTSGLDDLYAVTNSGGVSLQSGTIKPTGQVRMIKIDGVNNVRDLGGWTCDGGKLKYGLLYRGGELENATAAEIESVNGLLRIADEIDLRNTAEIPNDESEFPNADYVRIQLGQYLTAVDFSNSTLVSRTVSVLRRIFENVKYNRPTYFHCVSGADRTGTIAFLIEALCGVSRSDMDKDYELTSFTNEGESATRSRILPNWKNLVDYIGSMDGATYRDKAVSWCILAGITLAEINAFRHAMIDGTPADVTDQVDYSCKGIALDKDSGTIIVGGTVSLSATLSPTWATGTVTWSTSDSSVATVSGNGKTATVTGTGAGNATITATCNGHSTTYSVQVIVAQLVYRVTSTGLTEGVKIDSGDHKTTTTGQTNYAATDYVSTSGETHYKLANNFTGFNGDNRGNMYLIFYNASQSVLGVSETAIAKTGAAADTINGELPSGTAYYRVRAYSGDNQRSAYFQATTVSLGHYE